MTAAKIKDCEVKADEIGTDVVLAGEIAANAVGASKVAGASKLVFAECGIFRSLIVAKNGTFVDDCSIQGANAGNQFIDGLGM